MKLINVRIGENFNFTVSCREAVVTRLMERSRGPDRRMLATIGMQGNTNLMRNRVGRVNSMLKDHPQFEKIKIVTETKRLVEEGPRCAIGNGYYLDMGQIADYLPVMHGVLGFLRGGKTLELALAKISIGACLSLGYDEEIEDVIPFNGTQTFLKNVWPGLWAEEFAAATKRYRSPTLDMVFATFLAHYMGWTEGMENPKPWGVDGAFEIRINTDRLSRETKHIPTYFFNAIRAFGVNRYGEGVSSSLGYARIIKPYKLHVYMMPDSIFQQIPFFGKPEEQDEK